MEWNTQLIENVQNKIMVYFALFYFYRVSSKIKIVVSLMYRGSTLLYPYFLKGPSSLNLPYIQYVLAFCHYSWIMIIFGNYVLVFFALVGPTHHAHWATMGAKYTSVETTWNPYPYAYRMRTAIASSGTFLPCILKKIKCEYFLQSVPSQPAPPPPPPPHERANEATGGTLKHGQQLFLT